MPAVFARRCKVKARGDAHRDNAADVVVHAPARRELAPVHPLGRHHAGKEVEAHRLQHDAEAEEQEKPQKIVLLRAAEIDGVIEEIVERAEGGDLHQAEERRLCRIGGAEQPAEDVRDAERQKPEGERGAAPALRPRRGKDEGMHEARRDRKDGNRQDDDELHLKRLVVKRRLPDVRRGVVFGRDGHVGAHKDGHEGQRILGKEERQKPQQQIEIEDGKL